MRRAPKSEPALDAALGRARRYDRTRPVAVGAVYRRRNDQVVVRFASGAELAIPRLLLQGLADATPRQLAVVEVTDLGTGLHWETLDVDHYIPGLLAGVFGTPRWMANLTLARRAAAGG